jgi:hypothetical protein
MCSYEKWRKVTYPHHADGEDSYVDRQVDMHRNSHLGTLQDDKEPVVCGWVRSGEIERIERLGTLAEHTGVEPAVAEGVKP